MKRIFPVAAVAAGAVFLGACGSSTHAASGSGASSGTTPASSPASTAPPAPSKVTLNETGSTNEYPYLQTIAGPFHTAYPDITGGSSPRYLEANQFEALPTSVIARVKVLIDSIS